MDRTEAGSYQSQIHHFPQIPKDLVDVILVAEGGELHVNRAILALHSPVFHTMFFSDFKEKSEMMVPLPDEKFQDMVTFVNALLPTTPASQQLITDENLIPLMKLADKFDTQHVTVQCLDFIKHQLFLFYYRFYNEFTKSRRVLDMDTIHKGDVSGQTMDPTVKLGHEAEASSAEPNNVNDTRPRLVGFPVGSLLSNNISPTSPASHALSEKLKIKQNLKGKLVLYMKAYEYTSTKQHRAEVISLVSALCDTLADLSDSDHYASLSSDTKVDLLECLCKKRDEQVKRGHYQ